MGAWALWRARDVQACSFGTGPLARSRSSCKSSTKAGFGGLLPGLALAPYQGNRLSLAVFAFQEAASSFLSHSMSFSAPVKASWMAGSLRITIAIDFVCMWLSSSLDWRWGLGLVPEHLPGAVGWAAEMKNTGTLGRERGSEKKGLQ